MPLNYTIKTRRGSNDVDAQTAVFHHPTNPLVRVRARNVKLRKGNGYYDVVRAYYGYTKLGPTWYASTLGLSKEQIEQWFGAPVTE